MVSARSTQGYKVSISEQADFVTKQTSGFRDIWMEGDATIKTPAGVAHIPDSKHSNHIKNDKPIVFDEAIDDFATVTVATRNVDADLVGSDESSTEKLFKAGGYTVVDSGADSTLSAYVDTGDFTSTDDIFEAGYGATVELDNGQYWPILVAANTGGALTPAMDLPSASSTTNNIMRTTTITQGAPAQVTATNLLTLKATIKAPDGANDTVYDATSCAVTAIGDITMAPNELLQIEFTIGCAQYSYTSGTLADNDYLDGVSARYSDGLVCRLNTASTSGGIASSCTDLISGTFRFNVTLAQLRAQGCSTTILSNLGGWIQQSRSPEMDIEVYYDKTFLTEYEGTNESKYLEIVLPATASTETSLAYILPNCHQYQSPEWSMADEAHKMTVYYRGNPAGYDGTTASDQGNQAAYMLIGERSS